MRDALQQNSDLTALASALGTQVRTEDGVGFNTQVITGLGREPKFGGAAFGLSQGARSNVIEGGNAAFVMHVTQVSEPAALSDSQRQSLRTQLLNQRRNQVVNDWITTLRDQARVDDHRSRFLQF
jgi:peptidyl-prolyl cis-trans isomerase D